MLPVGRVIGLCAGQLLNGRHILDQQGRTMKFGDVLLAKSRERTSDRLARHADNLADLIMGQGHLDSVSCGQRGSSCDQSSIRRAIRWTLTDITNERSCWYAW